jgi:hypothetical protein
VFSPGYRTGRRSGAGPADDTQRPGRYGSAGSAATKGPVRGFPPAPGQPPPLYPPGQFSAWNRTAGPVTGEQAAVREPGLPMAGSQAGADRGTAGYGSPGYRGPEQADEPGYADAGQRTGPGPAADGPGEYPGAEFEPGYSVLAVSDPAADVTSTQTWGAVADGRETGTWSALRGPAAGGWSPGGAAADGGRVPSGTVPSGTVPSGTVPSGTVPSGTGPGLDRPGQPHEGRPSGWPPDAADERPAAAAGASPPGTRRGPETMPGQARGSPAGGHGGGRRGARTSPRKRGRSARWLAGSLAVVLAVAAATFLVLRVLHHGSARQQAAGGTLTSPSAGSSPSPSASPTPSPPPGPWRYIATRADDPAPLTLAELFPLRFSAGGTYTRTVRRSGKNCGSALVGSGLQSAVRKARCTQVLRASYLSLSKKQMGTIGVLNLKTFSAARKAGKEAGSARFIKPLDAAKGPTRNLAKATGLEEAEVKGHYLILVLADFTNLHAPKTRAQRRTLETFMSQLFRQTVNLSLTSRMVTGKP